MPPWQLPHHSQRSRRPSPNQRRSNLPKAQTKLHGPEALLSGLFLFAVELRCYCRAELTFGDVCGRTNRSGEIEPRLPEPSPSRGRLESHPYLPQAEILDFSSSHKVVMLAFAPLGHGITPGVLKEPVIKRLRSDRQGSPPKHYSHGRSSMGLLF